MSDFLKEVGGGAVKILWEGDLVQNLRAGKEKVQKAAWATAQSMAPEVETYMKLNAPWTDQTTNARNGLAARAYAEGSEIGIVLFHQVSYGIFLETRFGGQYAIIDPTIAEMSPRVMARFERLMERI